jgi:hypothetical protein
MKDIAIYFFGILLFGLFSSNVYCIEPKQENQKSILSISTAKVSLSEKKHRSSSVKTEDDEDKNDFEKFKSKFNKKYKDKDEEDKRLTKFKNCKKIVKKRNSEKRKYKLDYTKFCDITEEETKKLLTLTPPNRMKLNTKQERPKSAISVRNKSNYRGKIKTSKVIKSQLTGLTKEW